MFRVVDSYRAAREVGYCAEAKALFAASPGQTPSRKRFIDGTIRFLKSDAAENVWSSCRAIWVPTGTGIIKTLNWKDPASFVLVPNGGYTWDDDAWFIGNGSTGFLNTQLNPSTQGGGIFTLNSAHLSVVVGNAVTDTSFDVGTGTTLRISSRSFASVSGRINSATTHTLPAVATSVGHTILIRRDASNQLGGKDGAAPESASGASTSVGSANLMIGGNISGTFSTRRIGAVTLGDGAGLSDQKWASLNTALAAWPT